MSIEENVFYACNEPHEKRDWTPEEKGFIRESTETRTALILLLEEPVSAESWTPENRRFIEDFMKESSL